jgi:hypothetical protein
MNTERRHGATAYGDELNEDAKGGKDAKGQYAAA